MAAVAFAGFLYQTKVDLGEYQRGLEYHDRVVELSDGSRASVTCTVYVVGIGVVQGGLAFAIELNSLLC